MDFPKEFKDFKECQKFFDDKHAGMFCGEKEVAVRVLSNDSKKEFKAVYTVNKDKSLTRDDSQTEPETKPSSVKERRKEPEKKPEPKPIPEPKGKGDNPKNQ